MLTETIKKYLPSTGARTTAVLALVLPGWLYTNLPDYLAILPPSLELHKLLLRLSGTLVAILIPLIFLLYFIIRDYRKAIEARQYENSMIDIANRARHSIEALRMKEIERRRH